jgi:hypothetical protein
VNEAPVEESETANNGETRIKKGRKTTTKRSGPSCADRIVALKTKSFFSEPRSNGDVKDGLKTDGHSYASNQVAATLTNLHSRGELRRTGAEGKWLYVNP